MASRNRASAKAAGAKFERTTADWMAEHIDDRIDRRVKTGAKDKGDIAGVRHPVTGARIVVECKDWGGVIKAAEAMGEVEVETVNDNAVAGYAVIKRKGIADPGKQWVLTTVEHMARLIEGK